MQKIFIILCLLISNFKALATTEARWERPNARFDSLEFSILTFSPGKSIEELWGHIALHISDPKTQDERLYNWGMFSFDQDLAKGFATGKLRFWVDSEPVKPSLSFYKRQGRHIQEYFLNLTPERKNRLGKMVITNLAPKNREYDYEYFRDNCATRIRDILNDVYDDALKQQSEIPSKGGTRRDYVHRLTARNPVVDLTLSFLLGPFVDEKINRWNELFIPEALGEFLQEVKIRTKDHLWDSLVSQKKEVTPPKDGNTFSAWNYKYWDILFGIVLGIASYYSLKTSSPSKKLKNIPAIFIAILYSCVWGIPGFALAFFNINSSHTYTFWNINIFFGNPISLLLAPSILFFIKKRNFLFKICATLTLLNLVGFTLLMLNTTIQESWTYAWASLPWNLGFSLAAFLGSDYCIKIKKYLTKELPGVKA